MNDFNVLDRIWYRINQNVFKLSTCCREQDVENNLTKMKHCRQTRCVHKHRQRSFTPCFLKVGGNNLSHNPWYNRLKTHFHRTKAPKRSLKH